MDSQTRAISEVPSTRPELRVCEGGVSAHHQRLPRSRQPAMTAMEADPTMIPSLGRPCLVENWTRNSNAEFSRSKIAIVIWPGRGIIGRYSPLVKSQEYFTGSRFWSVPDQPLYE